MTEPIPSPSPGPAASLLCAASPALAQSTLNALTAHVAVLDQDGVILMVNDAWRRFARENGGLGSDTEPGANYFAPCQRAADTTGDETAEAALQGIRSVLGGSAASFCIEYPCHALEKQRWFCMNVRPLSCTQAAVVVAHEDITQFKQTSERLLQTALRRQQQADVLGSIASSPFLADGRLEELSRLLTEQSSKTLAVERVGIWFLAEQATQLRSFDSYQATSRTHAAGTVLHQGEIRDEFAVLETTAYVSAEEALSDPRTRASAERYLRPNRVVSLLDAVVRAGGRLLGILRVEHVGTRRHWESDEITFACQLADQLALAVLNRERRQAEGALRESEERFRMLFHAHSAIMLIIDPATASILDANSAAASFYGWSIDQLRGMPLRQINTLPPEAFEAAFDSARSARKDHFEFRHRRADGSIRDVEVFSNRLEVGGKALLYSIIHDITERKQAEQAKEALEDQNRLLLKSESLSRMAAAVAHLFNNHLQAVLMNLELARLQLPPGTHSPGQLLIDASESARKAAETSVLMLTYLGHAPGQHDPIDLSQACARSLPLLRAGIPRNVTLETSWPTPGPIVHANPRQIELVLTNLLNNACEALGTGPGTIRIEIHPCPHDHLPSRRRFPVDWSPKGPAYACLSIEDSGCGISAQDQDRIFDPFFSTKFTGRGLGLSVVLGIVRGHDGAVSVESTPRRGSIFRVHLPIAAAPLPARGELPPQPPPPTTNGVLLVVDDDACVRESTAASLARRKFTVLTAADGMEAVRIFEERHRDIRCVILDLTMPRMGGWETLSALRAISPNHPVILASGYDEATAMSGAHDEIPQAFLGKPYGSEKLFETLARVLPSEA
jgi:PAS domain S-box-containing protein